VRNVLRAVDESSPAHRPSEFTQHTLEQLNSVQDYSLRFVASIWTRSVELAQSLSPLPAHLAEDPLWHDLLLHFFDPFSLITSPDNLSLLREFTLTNPDNLCEDIISRAPAVISVSFDSETTINLLKVVVFIHSVRIFP
jgi:hypothetical protein